MSTVTCGSTHDSMALNLSELGETLADKSHPINASDFWIAGDDAYDGPANCCTSLLTPHKGKNLSAERDAFNFYQSRNRIEIECAFGALVARFGVLQRNLKVSLEHTTLLLSALCKLHNVCMERKMPLHKGRVNREEFSGRTYGGDQPPEWSEWAELGDPEFMDDVDRGDANRGRTTVKQRGRVALTKVLKDAGWVRPSYSDCTVYRQRRRGEAGL